MFCCLYGQKMIYSSTRTQINEINEHLTLHVSAKKPWSYHQIIWWWHYLEKNIYIYWEMYRKKSPFSDKSYHRGKNSTLSIQNSMVLKLLALCIVEIFSWLNTQISSSRIQYFILRKKSLLEKKKKVFKSSPRAINFRFDIIWNTVKMYLSIFDLKTISLREVYHWYYYKALFKYLFSTLWSGLCGSIVMLNLLFPQKKTFLQFDSFYVF